MRPIFDGVQQPLFCLSPNGRWTYANRALLQLIGSNGPEVTNGPACFPCLSDDYLGFVKRLVRDKQPEYEGTEVKLELLGTDGRRIEVQFVYSALCTEHGEPTTHVFLARDAGSQGKVMADRYRETFDRFARELVSIGIKHDTPQRPGDSDGRACVDVNQLSLREVDVLRELLRGRSTNEIARTLFISTHTVRNHLKSMFRKLGVHSQRELIVRCRDLV